MGNPSLSDIRVMLIGVRNKSNSVKDGCVWVNELKVTDFNESGGWAAKANVNLALSDIATVNFSGHVETAGFGGVDQGLSARRLDDYKQYNIAVQGDVGRLVPEKVKLSAPVYYSKSNETITRNTILLTRTCFSRMLLMPPPRSMKRIQSKVMQ